MLKQDFPLCIILEVIRETFCFCIWNSNSTLPTSWSCRVSLMKTAWMSSSHQKRRNPLWVWPLRMRRWKSKLFHSLIPYTLQLIQGSWIQKPLCSHFSWWTYSPFHPRKKKRERGKKKGSDDSDSDDVEVIKEWNTSSRGRNGEGRNRRASVEEGKYSVATLSGHFRPLMIKRSTLLWYNARCFFTAEHNFS